MAKNEAQDFADDSPKSNPWTDDLLGFSNFAERVAEALVRQNAPNGYVIGLHGEWGSGKTTVLNFVRSYLRKWLEESNGDVTNLQWFDFEPWVVSGHQDLASAFLKVLSEKLGDSGESKARFRRGTKAAIGMGSGPLIDTVSMLGFLVDHTGGAASKAGATFTKAAIKKGSEKWLAEPSLQKTYDQLVERLRKSGRRFIVFVDDIDRLTGTEIRSLMQMVKTIGRLPNVTYCLSYDRQIVWSALRDLAPGDGVRSGYAEKIVQHELEVPVPSRSGLMRMLNASLPDLPPNPERVRWSEILQYGLQRWIRHPRDVVRLANAMHFSWAALKDEVDAYDMLCMEALRLFDRKVFNWIRDNRDILLGDELPFSSEDRKTPEAAEELAHDLSQDARADVIRLMHVLFANQAKLFGKQRIFSNERWENVVKRRGIATAAGYSAYFSLAPSPSAIPKRLIEEAVNPAISPKRQIELINHAIGLIDETGTSLIGEYLNEISVRVGDMDPTTMGNHLRSLIDRTEAIRKVNEAHNIFGASSWLHTVVQMIVDRLGPGFTANILDEVFVESERVGALAAMYVWIGTSQGAIPGGDGSLRMWIPSDRFSALGAVLLPKIIAQFDEDTLTELPSYYDVARAWAHLDGTVDPKRWITREATRNVNSLVKVSKLLLGTTYDQSGYHYSFNHAPDIDIYDFDAIADGCDLFLHSFDVNEDDRDRISVLRKGLAKLKAQDIKRMEIELKSEL